MQLSSIYKNSGSTLLILAGVALLQGCSLIEMVTSTPTQEFTKDNGMGKALDAVVLKQTEEYKSVGKFTSMLKLNVQCYQAYSKISPTNDAVTNFAIRKPCWDVDSVSVVAYVSKVFVGTKTTGGNSRIVEVRCITDSAPYIPGSKDESLEPHWVREKFPECPRAYNGKNILPLYRDHSIQKKPVGLSDKESIVKELDRISSRQVEEFAKTGEYASALAFSSECGVYASTISQDSKAVINWIIPTQECYDPSPSLTHEKFVSAVFAVKNKQHAVTLWRIICTDPGDQGSINGITQKPPRLVNDVPVCTTDESSPVKKILRKQYSPVPTRQVRGF